MNNCNRTIKSKIIYSGTLPHGDLQRGAKSTHECFHFGQCSRCKCCSIIFAIICLPKHLEFWVQQWYHFSINTKRPDNFVCAPATAGKYFLFQDFRCSTGILFSVCDVSISFGVSLRIAFLKKHPRLYLFCIAKCND